MNEADMGICGLDAVEIYRKYWPMVLRRCRRLLGDDCAAADAAQTVFLKLLKNKRNLNVEYPSSLLWTIATNHCLNVLRDNKRYGRRLEERVGEEALLDKIAACGDLEAKLGARRVLRKLFSKTPASSRTIAVLHLVDGMTLEETAREVNMSVSGVRKRLRTLRKILVELEDL